MDAPIEAARCGKCHRPLKNPASIALGFGPSCLKFLNNPTIDPNQLDFFDEPKQATEAEPERQRTMIHFTQSIELEVEVEGTFKKGTPDFFSKSHGNWLPGDPDDAEIKHVWVTSRDGKNRIDLLDYISESDVQALEESITELGRDEG